MKYVAITFDGKHFQFDEVAKDRVEKLWRSGAIVPFREGKVKGSDIRRIEPVKNMEVNRGSDISIHANKLFIEPSRKNKEFWGRVLRLNNDRHLSKKKWIYSNLIEEIKKSQGLETADEVFSYILENKLDESPRNEPVILNHVN